MLSWLSDIFNVLTHLGAYALWAIVSGINALIVALAAAIALILSLLPSLPDSPDAPPYVGVINWFFPLGTITTFFGVMITAYVVWLGIRILARWVKAA